MVFITGLFSFFLILRFRVEVARANAARTCHTTQQTGARLHTDFSGMGKLREAFVVGVGYQPNFSRSAGGADARPNQTSAAALIRLDSAGAPPCSSSASTSAAV